MGDRISVRFGPAGQADNYKGKSSAKYPAWLAEQGLDAFEYQCGKGVNVGEETARAVGEAARTHGIALSLHAPYFINLANPDPESLKKTTGYILAACQAADWMGATRVTVHTGALMKRTRREALDIAKRSLREVLAACDGAGFGQAADWMGATRVTVHTGALMKRTRREALDIAKRSLREVLAACDGAGFGYLTLCPETMGKINQLGDLDEVLELCQLDERLLPCIDFGHLYARSLGELEGLEATAAMLDRVEELLGPDRASRFHSHFSKIAFTPNGGEKVHLTFDQTDFGPDPAPLMGELARRGWSPTIICESAGTQDVDALTMKELYLTAMLGRENPA